MSIIGKVVGAIIGYLITRNFMGAIIGTPILCILKSENI